MFDIKKIRETIESKPAHSAWNNGVKVYALELLESLEEGIHRRTALHPVRTQAQARRRPPAEQPRNLA